MFEAADPRAVKDAVVSIVEVGEARGERKCVDNRVVAQTSQVSSSLNRFLLLNATVDG